MPSALTAQQQQQQKLRLQRIQMERERIRMRQEELLRQVTLRIRFYFAQEHFFYQVQVVALLLFVITTALGKDNKK